MIGRAEFQTPGCLPSRRSPLAAWFSTSLHAEDIRGEYPRMPVLGSQPDDMRLTLPIFDRHLKGAVGKSPFTLHKLPRGYPVGWVIPRGLLHPVPQ